MRKRTDWDSFAAWELLPARVSGMEDMGAFALTRPTEWGCVGGTGLGGGIGKNHYQNHHHHQHQSVHLLQLPPPPVRQLFNIKTNTFSIYLIIHAEERTHIFCILKISQPDSAFML